MTSMKKLLAAVLVAILVGCAGQAAAASPVPAPAASPVPAPAASPVPAQYRSLYGRISGNLNAFARAVTAMPTLGHSRKRQPPMPGAELLAANGNRLSALLTSNNMQLVDTSLDRLKQLGVKGVTLGIKVPMLLSSFTPDATRYASFYAAVADHARARGMVVSVELGALFCGTVFARCSDPFGHSYQTFVDDSAAQAAIVIKRVKPTYLTLFSEPDTEAKLIGVPTLDTPSGAAAALADILRRMGPRGSTRVGAGAPTWLSPSFARAIVAKPVDYLDTHIYPAAAQQGANAVAIARIASDAHKQLVVDEEWLYKNLASGGPTGGPAGAEADARQDLFSFWEPLDEQFLKATASWERKAGASYVSPFWSWQFFSYLHWTPALNSQSYPQLTAAFSRVLAPALAGGTTTPLGRQWSRELLGG